MRVDRLCAVSVVSLAATLTSSQAGARGEYSLPFEPWSKARIASLYTREAPNLRPASIPVAAQTVLRPTNSINSVFPSSTGDLLAIKHRKTLRVLMLREQAGEPGSRDVTMERDLITEFARGQGLLTYWLTVDTPRELIVGLREGQGDVVIGDIPLNVDQNPVIDRTVALSQVRYVVVTRAEDKRIKRKSDLYGLRVGLSESSPAWPLLRQLSAGHKSIEQVATERMGDREVLGHLLAGRYDFAVLESDGSNSAILGRNDLRVAFALTADKPMSWLVRRENPQLRAALNHHLNKHRLAWRVHETRHDDLAGIAKRGVLRIITRPDADNYFLSAGERAGFEYDMIREFARQQGLRMEVVVADSDRQMLAWLKSGVGDVVTARVASDLVDSDETLEASRIYHYVAPVLVSRADLPHPRSLKGQRVVVKRDSLYAQTLRDGVYGVAAEQFKIVEADPDRTLPELIDELVAGRADFTVIEGPRLNELLKYRDDIRAVFSLEDAYPYRFTLRADNPKLLAALNGFLKKEFGTEFYNAARRRYFENGDLYALRGPGCDQISPYDDLVKRYADRYSFDWRLIVAQMYEESRFHPHLVSSAGARGLMQVLPHTAHAMGFRDLSEPEAAIHAGVKYLGKQRERFAETLAVEDRTWFAVAAYHAGYDRVKAARQNAARLGLDPNRWFGNVEKAMLRLSGKRTSPNDYRGGSATVTYVREIRSRYEAYLQLQPATALASL